MRRGSEICFVNLPVLGPTTCEAAQSADNSSLSNNARIACRAALIRPRVFADAFVYLFELNGRVRSRRAVSAPNLMGGRYKAELAPRKSPQPAAAQNPLRARRAKKAKICCSMSNRSLSSQFEFCRCAAPTLTSAVAGCCAAWMFVMALLKH